MPIGEKGGNCTGLFLPSRICERTYSVDCSRTVTVERSLQMTIEEEPCAASAAGILNCLRLLADEAATLHLRRTLYAIQEAMETARRECAAVIEAPALLH